MWSWQSKDWPKFSYKKDAIDQKEKDLSYQAGILFGIYKHLGHEDSNFLKVELISNEALYTSEIEGEYLDRDSLQSSIRKHFGLDCDSRKIPAKERGISNLMLDLYSSYSDNLTHEYLFKWHRLLFKDWSDPKFVGKYRYGDEPMQIISGRLDNPTMHYEAPPSEQIYKEMDDFIKWFNDSIGTYPIITRAAIAHLFFELIHPFEDGNGRIGRAIVEKALSQAFKMPLLTSLSTIINRDRNAYYKALESANKSLDITDWLIYFSDIIMQSIIYTQKNIEFLIFKAKLFDQLRDCINKRQEKCLLRIFKSGPDGFIGGLSAENYISITKSTRPTATRDLADLCLKGAFVKKGELKSTRYFLNLKVLDS